jgi:hypothetical protein
MTYYLREGPVENLAQLFHENTCPGDWKCHPTLSLGCDLETFYQGDSIEAKKPTAANITSVIRYRWEVGLLADQIVNR